MNAITNNFSLRIYYSIINYATITRASTERKHKRGESQANTI